MVRSKYCFQPENLSSPVFQFDSVYIRSITEGPEDLLLLYVIRDKKESTRTFGVFRTVSREKMMEVSKKKSSSHFLDTFLQVSGTSHSIHDWTKTFTAGEKNVATFFRSTAFCPTRDRVDVSFEFRWGYWTVLDVRGCLLLSRRRLFQHQSLFLSQNIIFTTVNIHFSL